MKKTKLSLFLALTFLMSLALTSAGAAQMLHGDAPVDGRTYPSTSPFIHPPFYNVRLSVTLDEAGKIQQVTDNETGLAGSVESKEMEELWIQKNKPYWDAALKTGLLDKFVGKTLEEVKALDMHTGEADATTGATMVGLAVQEAVINALEGKKGKTFLPGVGSVMPLVSCTDNTVTLKNNLPADFELQLLDIRQGIYNDEASIVPADSYTFESKDGQAFITFQHFSALVPGKYYVNVVDASGTYRSPHFESGHGEEDAAQAPYFIVDSGLKAEDISLQNNTIILSKGDIGNYLKNLEHVLLLKAGEEKPVEQEPVGHHGTVNTRFNVLTPEGAINPDATIYNRKENTETPLFVSGQQYTITISAFGYPEVSFPYTEP